MTNIEEEQISSVKPSDSVIIRQINELNNYIGKLQVDKSYHNMSECD